MPSTPQVLELATKTAIETELRSAQSYTTKEKASYPMAEAS